MPTPNETIVTEEQVKKDNERFQELNKKSEAERTAEEVKELGELKERHSSRAEKRINELTWKSKIAEERATELEEKLNKSLAEIDELKKLKEERTAAKTVKEEFVEIAGKKYYTDDALTTMVQNKEITDTEAYAYQRKRDKEEIKNDLRKEREEHQRQENDKEIRMGDANEVRKQYPHFSKDHKDFNPEDPVYKKALEIWSEGYSANPRGLSLSIKRAKEILRIQDTAPDRSSELGIESSSAPERGGGREKEATLSEEEKEIAIKQWGRGDIINPKTGKAYTEAESIAKGLEAKKRRQK